MRFPLYIFIGLTIILNSCGNPPEISQNATSETHDSIFKWIEGKYVVVNDQSGFYYEEWTKVDNNNYKGAGYFLTRDCVDTIFSLQMRLIHQKDKTTFFYDVKGHKESKENEFTLTKGENNVYVFENPFGVFPSIMQYKIIGDSAIDITQRGFENNKEKVIEYKATKIN